MLVKERDIACFCGGFSAAIVASLLLLVLLLGSVSCTSSRSVAPAHGPALVAPSPGLVQRLDSATLAGWLPTDLTGLPAYLVPPPPGSTAKQRRQWQKAQAQNLARAGVLPAKIKNSSVATAPGATAINRPAAPVATNGSTATDARKAGQRGGGGVATAPAASASAMGVVSSSKGGYWWLWLVVGLGCYLTGWRFGRGRWL